MHVYPNHLPSLLALACGHKVQRNHTYAHAQSVSCLCGVAGSLGVLAPGIVVHQESQ